MQLTHETSITVDDKRLYTHYAHLENNDRPI